MAYFDDIYEHAVDNHYLITTADAANLGIPAVELAKLANRGRLEHVARGLYRLARYVPSESDAYAIAVARVGGEAFLFGESVIAMLGLAPTNPNRIWVASPRRVRLKSKPPELRIVPVSKDRNVTVYDGVKSQKVADAIRSCMKTMLPERIGQAIERAKAEGYVTEREYEELKEEAALM